MAIDWANERFVKLYTRNTSTWRLLSWEARTVLLHLLREVDRFGRLDVSDDGIEGLAAVLNLPLEITAVGIDHLERRGVVVSDGQSFTLPKFTEAQESRTSARRRQSEYRDRMRDKTASSPVDKRDTPLRAVTPRNDQNRTEQILIPASAAPPPPPSFVPVPAPPSPTLTPPPQGAGVRVKAKAKTKKRSVASAEHLAIARELWDLQEKLRMEVIPGATRLAPRPTSLARITWLLANGYSREDLERALHARAAEVKKDPEQAEWFNGTTSWDPENVDTQLGRYREPKPAAKARVESADERRKRLEREQAAEAERKAGFVRSMDEFTSLDPGIRPVANSVPRPALAGGSTRIRVVPDEATALEGRG